MAAEEIVSEGIPAEKTQELLFEIGSAAVADQGHPQYLLLYTTFDFEEVAPFVVVGPDVALLDEAIPIAAKEGTGV